MSAADLGRALMQAWGDDPRKRSYTATGWHAQISKLTQHSRGSWAADQAGLDVSHTTVVRWLSYGGPEDQAPTAENQAKINRAYQLLAGGIWDPSNETREYRIKGTVKTGSDIRDRGSDGQAALLIDGSSGSWDRIREAYESGEITDKDAGEWFISDVIVEDIGEGSDGWEFPGSSYSV